MNCNNQEVVFRVYKLPSMSFKEFVKSKGYSDSDLPSDFDYANYIGGCLSAKTSRAKGKLKPIIKKIALYNSLQEQYDTAIKEGTIKLIEHRRLIMDTEQDRAYLRMLKKREAKKLVS